MTTHKVPKKYHDSWTLEFSDVCMNTTSIKNDTTETLLIDTGSNFIYLPPSTFANWQVAMQNINMTCDRNGNYSSTYCHSEL